MGLIGWTLTAVCAGAVAVILAFINCAIAELVVRIAARLYIKPGLLRNARRKEWIGALDDMNWKERPGHAGTLLWRGLRELPTRKRWAKVEAVENKAKSPQEHVAPIGGLDPRKKAIVDRVVQEYIASAVPVGSESADPISAARTQTDEERSLG